MRVDAHGERIEITREGACSVRQRLTARELQLFRCEVDRGASELRHACRERDAGARRVLREVEAERRTGEERLFRVLAELDRIVEDRFGLGRDEIRAAQEVAADEGDFEGRRHDHRSLAAATAAATSPRRSPAGGASKVPARTAGRRPLVRRGTACLATSAQRHR
jgi:hypothetical protein